MGCGIVELLSVRCAHVELGNRANFECRAKSWCKHRPKGIPTGNVERVSISEYDTDDTKKLSAPSCHRAFVAKTFCLFSVVRVKHTQTKNNTFAFPPSQKKYSKKRIFHVEIYSKFLLLSLLCDSAINSIKVF